MVKCQSLGRLIMGVIRASSSLRKLIGVNENGGVKLLREAPPPLPKGYVPVCVGTEDGTTKRFMVHTTTLSDADFLELLGKSAEEYGFCNDGVLRIPYEANRFEEWMNRRRLNQKILRVEQVV